MKKKATLLIQHLEAVYALYPKLTSVFHHAYIAVYHDRILALGEGSGSVYIDKDTKIIEGRGHIAIPGMLDVAVNSVLFHRVESDTARNIITLGNHFLRHGTMLIHTENTLPQALKEMLKYPTLPDYHDLPYQQRYPIIYPLHDKAKRYRRFCISCGYENTNCLDLWLCVKLYAYRHRDIDPLSLLGACTCYPAKMLELSDYGIIKPKAKANIILLSGNHLADPLQRFHGDEAMQIIKDGIRLFPK